METCVQNKTLIYRLTQSPQSIFALKAMPVPATEKLTVEFQHPTSDSYVLHIVDVTGKLVETYNGRATEGRNTLVLNLNNLASGTYILRLSTSSGEQEIRFMVQK